LWKRPTAAQLRGTGLKAKHYIEPHVDVWPENWPALQLYASNRSQWIQGAGGPTGLNYSWFVSELQRKGVDSEEIDQIMDGLRVIEDAVLEKVYEGR
jgi:hypothetical protein